MFILSNLLNYGTYVILAITLISLYIYKRFSTNLPAAATLIIVGLTYFIFMSLIISIVQIYNNNFISQSTILYNKRTSYLGYILLFLIALIILIKEKFTAIKDIFNI